MYEMKPNDKRCIVNAFAQLKEGEVIELAGSGKTFTKWAGLLVAPDIEACEWIKENIGNDFFHRYIVRIMYAHPERFSSKSNQKWT